MPGKSYSYTGGWQTFVVPKGVTYVTATLQGAGSNGVRGGAVSGRIKVSGGQTLYIQVGQSGRANSGGTGGGTAFGGGGAGGAGNGHAGGYGGGGATAIRVSSRTGTIRAVAAGAGGSSGDGGKGGKGGALVGENGWPGTAGPVTPVGNATGGTQIQGGNGGTSGSGTTYDGLNAIDVALATGGRGGQGGTNTYGGGGGGGGYRAGGGGQAGLVDAHAGGGGGGGANYTGGLIGYSSTQAGGSTTNGSVSLSWVAPAPANQPPSPPTDVLVNGVADVDELATRSTGSVTVSAKIDDPNSGQAVRLVVYYSANRDFTSQVKSVVSGPVDQAKRASTSLKGLSQNTRYYARLYTRDSKGLLSSNYKSINFWTNRFPTEPLLVAPADNTTISQLSSVVFQWTHQDPDPNSTQRAFQLQYRRMATPLRAPGDWVTVSFTTWFNQYVANPGSFQANTFYEWHVRTQDSQGAWGAWGAPQSFYVSGLTSAPQPLSPIRDEALDVTQSALFKWKFRDPDQGDDQKRADLRYRVVGSTEWITRIGSDSEPGHSQQWTLPSDMFTPGMHYEWQARTTDSLTSAISDWSESAFFWAIRTPGVAVANVRLPAFTTPLERLGCGMNRVFVYDRGGTVLRGEITPTQSVTWNRKRDDISSANIETNGFGIDCGDLLREIHCWMHEIVIFRDGERVWEGPITRITDSPTGVSIEAKDVMGYVYRRIMRQGYNDTWRKVNGQELGDYSVVERAARIVMNALAPDDPNVLAYLTTFNFPDDAPQSRSVPDFAKTAWEEVDDMAATAGLDYVTTGRRIIFNDTHRPIGRLPEMRDDHFSDPPVISEYGMQLATDFGVTNNSGVYGLASHPEGHAAYGLVEMLASAYGEAEGTVETALTSASRAVLEGNLTVQAGRNIAGRFPTPIEVRVPDNSSLNPETPLGINQLVPGVWIPLRARGTIREVAQWQKLDLVTVEQTDKGEQVRVTMSPAPDGGADPDAEGASKETE